MRRVARFCAAFLTIAFAAIEYPAIEAMNLDAISTKPYESSATVMPIITANVRQRFLDPLPQAQTLSLEITKEAFFRAHVPYGSIIYREALKNQLPPELVAAIVQTESDFNVRLISGKKAQGLMQIVPETAQLLGVTDPFDPDQNIAAGTKYLRYLMNRFPHDERLVLAAYNAGETKVAREGIPDYEETRAYIEKVHSRTRSYEQRVRRSYAIASKMRGAF